MRLLLTAITLLFVLGLNNREVTTFAATPPAKAGQKVNSSATTERHGTVKQKVSFEATPSYTVLQMAAVPEFLRINFVKPFSRRESPNYPRGIIFGFFNVFLATAIQANAP